MAKPRLLRRIRRPRLHRVDDRGTELALESVVLASLSLLDAPPYLAGRIVGFRSRMLEPAEALAFAVRALRLRYSSDVEPPAAPARLLDARRAEDQGSDLWHTLNRVQVNLIRGGVADGHRDRRGRLRSVRGLRGIDSKVDLNKRLWGMAERLANGEPLDPIPTVSIIVDRQNIGTDLQGGRDGVGFS